MAYERWESEDESTPDMGINMVVDPVMAYTAETDRMALLLEIMKVNIGQGCNGPATLAEKRLVEMLQANQRFVDG